MSVVVLVLLCGTCFAERWVPIFDDTPEKPMVDLDSVKTMTVGYDNIIRYITKMTDSSNGEYYISTTLVDTDNTTYCDQLIIKYSKYDKELRRTATDPRFTKNWTIYNDKSFEAAVLRVIKENQ
jgi:hypothetical protein